ncbi:glycosyltransferase family 2 protein [Halochromatium salexigens]|uniref:glycosyltransferase family 2 protein n=1 Tax=Halochromatium salexigens TaxID=49447 RepID=UPI001A917D64|nr:glycosyltransferase family 2 protein [Halochromatium salexigens]
MEKIFDAHWYQEKNPDLAIAQCDALEHYLKYGAVQKRSPHPLFDTAWYMGRYPEVVGGDQNPLQHYLEHGARRGYDPHPLFDSDWYLERYPEVVTSGENPLRHYLERGALGGFDPHPLFASDWYLLQHQDVAAAGINPLVHYVEYGAAEGRDPNPFFDSDWYLSCNTDVAASGVNPLVHFVCHGAIEGRAPNPLFDLSNYRRHQPSVALAGINPLAHFLRFGIEGSSLQERPSKARETHQSDAAYGGWLWRNRWDSTAEARAHAAVGQLLQKPLFTLILTDTDPSADVIRRVLLRLEEQIYPDWELCAFVSKACLRELKAFLKTRPEAAQRLILLDTRPASPLSKNGLRRADEAARGTHVLLLSETWRLAPAALTSIALALDRYPDTDLVYSDHDHYRPDGLRYAPAFKPDWSPELLLSYPYIGAAFCLRRDLFGSALQAVVTNGEGLPSDLLLCAADKPVKVIHVAQVLFHSEAPPQIMAEKVSQQTWQRIVQAALDRRRLPAQAYQPDWAQREDVPATALKFADTGPHVAIIIPTRNYVRVLRKLIVSLAQTRYQNYSVHVVDNESDDPETLEYLAQLEHQVIRIASPQGCFNFSYINNQAVSQVEADNILFLNNDTEIIAPDWLSAMVGYLSIPGVGAVGAKLLFPDYRVQHAGVLLGTYNGLPGHAFGHLPAGEHGYLRYAEVARDYSAVTAACMLTPRQLFLDSGGFDEHRFAVAFNDVDYCLRLGEAGYRIVYCPTASLIHHGGLSRGAGDDPAEEAAILQRAPRRDPYYNPNLSDDGLFTPRADGPAWEFAALGSSPARTNAVRQLPQ